MELNIILCARDLLNGLADFHQIWSDILSGQPLELMV